MKLLIVLACVIVAALGEECTPEVCKLEEGCVCTKSQSPIAKDDTPQFVVLTIDDAINQLQIDDFYKPLFSRKNPDGNAVGATFFIPHEYTDYSIVNQLYNQGFEIGVNSISKSTTDYWSKASEALLVDEFQGQKQIISHFANIPDVDILGARIPQFQLAGNKLFNAYKIAGLTYDSSWTALSAEKYFPYTLDFDSSQNCLIGECPTDSYPGFWISPINNIKGNGSIECNVLFACGIQGTADEIKDWMVSQFEVNFQKNRAPYKVLINSGYFSLVENGIEAFYKFMDYLAEKKEVFIVSEQQVIEWMKNPVGLAEYKTTVPERKQPCQKYACTLTHENGGERRMVGCAKCPAKYPWVGNPDGNK